MYYVGDSINDFEQVNGSWVALGNLFCSLDSINTSGILSSILRSIRYFDSTRLV